MFIGAPLPHTRLHNKKTREVREHPPRRRYLAGISQANPTLSLLRRKADVLVRSLAKLRLPKVELRPCFTSGPRD